MGKCDKITMNTRLYFLCWGRLNTFVFDGALITVERFIFQKRIWIFNKKLFFTVFSPRYLQYVIIIGFPSANYCPNVFRTHLWSSAPGVKGRLHRIQRLQSKNPHTLTGMISLGAKRNMKGILTSCGQGCVIVGAWRTAWATRPASQCQPFNKGFAGWNWRTKITQRGVLGKWDEGCKTGENAIRDKSRVQFNVFQSLSPFPAVSCAYEGGRKRRLHIACQQLSH